MSATTSGSPTNPQHQDETPAPTKNRHSWEPRRPDSRLSFHKSWPRGIDRHAARDLRSCGDETSRRLVPGCGLGAEGRDMAPASPVPAAAVVVRDHVAAWDELRAS